MAVFNLNLSNVFYIGRPDFDEFWQKNCDNDESKPPNIKWPCVLCSNNVTFQKNNLFVKKDTKFISKLICPTKCRQHLKIKKHIRFYPYISYVLLLFILY